MFYKIEKVEKLFILLPHQNKLECLSLTRIQLNVAFVSPKASGT
jgi:hypothetical protein